MARTNHNRTRQSGKNRSKVGGGRSPLALHSKHFKFKISNPFKAKNKIAKTPTLKSIKKVKSTPQKSAKKKKSAAAQLHLEVTPSVVGGRTVKFLRTPPSHTSTPTAGSSAAAAAGGVDGKKNNNRKRASVFFKTPTSTPASMGTRWSKRNTTPSIAAAAAAAAGGKPLAAIPPSPATIIAAESSGVYSQGPPIIIDETIDLEVEDAAAKPTPKSKPKANPNVVKSKAKANPKVKAKANVKAKKTKVINLTKEEGEITIDDSDDDDDEIQIVEEKLQPLPVLQRTELPASPAVKGFAEFAKDKNQQQQNKRGGGGGGGVMRRAETFGARDARRQGNRPYPAMGLRASSRGKLPQQQQQGPRHVWFNPPPPPPQQAAPVNPPPPPPPQAAPAAPTAVSAALSEFSAPNYRVHAGMGNVIGGGGAEDSTTTGTGRGASSRQQPPRQSGTLRPVVIDGSNVAVGHAISRGLGNTKFSGRGIDICVQYFRQRGHQDVTVIVPQYRTKSGQAEDRHLLEKLHRQGILSYTPSRSYDDRYILQYAALSGGVIVSNDNYEDVKNESREVLEAVNRRLLKFTWVKDTLMFPQDPLGRWGPSLQQFLRF